MSYNDPYYASHYPAGANAPYQPQTAGTSQEYYNPYNNPSEAYTDQPKEDQNQAPVYNNYPPPQREPTSMQPFPVRKESSGFDPGEFATGLGVAPVAYKDRSAQAYRDYRYGHQGNLCTKGGRVRCVGRICCCSLMTIVFLIVSIVLSLALWLRPPSITIGSVETNSSSIQVLSDGITINLGVDISVDNPNYFDIAFTKIEAQIFYPIDNTPIGGGIANNIDFRSHTQTNFTFPFSLDYNMTADPTGAIVVDLATKCGVLGNTKSNLDISYQITLGIRILMVTIYPVIQNDFSFACPLSGSDLSKFLGKFGKSII